MHAYVLMTNHVHLLLTPTAARSIPQIIQGLGRDYVQPINRRYKRTGTLWEGRVMDDIRSTTNACRVLGNAAFTEQIEAMLNRRVRPAKIGRPRKTKPV